MISNHGIVFVIVSLISLPSAAAEPTASEVFEKRILPIFKSPDPSSCVKCHLAGVDLKNYILPDAEKTFRSLRDQGLIDLEKPEKSKIVSLIEMGSNGPAVVASDMQKKEREAFLEWIKACAADPALRTAPKLEDKERAGPAQPVEVLRHARKDRVLESFEKNVWAWRFRCMNCHTEGTPQNQKKVSEFGERVAWVKKAGAEATMEYIIQSKLIDAEKPEASLLLTKPLGEDHKGGKKFAVGDDAYKGFRTWIEDVAAIRGGKYKGAADLPKQDNSPERFGTEIWFKLTDCPPEWNEKLLQVRIFAWDGRRKAWDDSPIAVSDRLAGKIWQHNLTLLTAKDSERAKTWRAAKPTLAEGQYLVKVFVDGESRLAKDWKGELNERDFAGQAEFRAKWREGYGAMTEVKAAEVRK